MGTQEVPQSQSTSFLRHQKEGRWETNKDKTNATYETISKTCKSPTHVVCLLPPQVVFLLTVPRTFLCCCSTLFVCLWFCLWRLFCHCVYPISHSVGTLRRLCFIVVEVPRYFHLYFKHVSCVLASDRL